MGYFLVSWPDPNLIFVLSQFVFKSYLLVKLLTALNCQICKLKSSIIEELRTFLYLLLLTIEAQNQKVKDIAWVKGTMPKSVEKY